MSFSCNFSSNISPNQTHHNTLDVNQHHSENLQGSSAVIHEEAIINISPNTSSKVSELLVKHLKNIYQNHYSRENFPKELKERFHSLKACHFEELELLISDLSQKLNQTDFNFSEALGLFFQEIECIDLKELAELFHSESNLHTLLRELHELKTSEYPLPHSPLRLPPLLTKFYGELKDWVLSSTTNSFYHYPPTLVSLFKEIDNLIFNKLDLGKIKTLEKKDIPLRLRKYTDEILSIKVNPSMDLNAAALAFATGFAPAGIMAGALNETDKLSTPLKFVLSAAPIFVGSAAQFWAGNQADNYGGRKTVLQLLATSAFGIASLATLISQIDLSSVEDLSPETLGLALTGIITGAGLSVVPATFTIATRSGRADEAGIRQGFVGGIGTLSPGIAIIAQAVAINQIGMSNAYFTLLGLSLTGTLLTHRLLNNSIYHQLTAKSIPPEKSKEIALWLGQELFPGSDICSVREKLKALSKSEKVTMSILAFNNVVSLGGLLSLIATLPIHFTDRGSPLFNSLAYTGAFSIINSLARTITGKTRLAKRGELATKVGLTALGLGSIGLTFSQNLSSSLPFLGITGIGMGISNYGLFSWLAEEVPNHFGIASGVVNGVGAMGGPVLALALGTLNLLSEAEDTKYQFLLLPALATVALLCNKYLTSENTNRSPQPRDNLTVEEVDDIEAQRRAVELQRI